MLRLTKRVIQLFEILESNSQSATWISNHFGWNVPKDVIPRKSVAHIGHFLIANHFLILLDMYASCFAHVGSKISKAIFQVVNIAKKSPYLVQRRILTANLASVKSIHRAMSTAIWTALVETFIPGNSVENFVKIHILAAGGPLMVEMIYASYGLIVLILERQRDF